MYRNVCILAHVDHGKTTIADCLCAFQGLISSKQNIRFLDSRQDEQQRGITLKSSSIRINFKLNEEFVLNLIDTPGHCDFFTSDVVCSAKLCDVAFVVVDVVEGITLQTIEILHLCKQENLIPVLILNKLDRFFQELQLNPEEIYLKLDHIICTANSFANIQMENIVFCSGLQRWGFRLKYFSNLFLKKLGGDCSKAMWGDEFEFDFKSKQIKKAKKPQRLAIKLCFENIFRVFHSDAEKICTKLNLRGTPSEILSQWLPLSTALLACAASCPQKQGNEMGYISRPIIQNVMLCRLFQGKLNLNQKLWFQDQLLEIEELYHVMGNELLKVNEVEKGDVFGMKLKNVFCNLNFSTVQLPNQETNVPCLLRVAIEPECMKDFKNIQNALLKLEQIDPFAKVEFLETGEQILSTTGDVHLQKCVKDLETLSEAPFTLSEPIVKFRETITKQQEVELEDISIICRPHLENNLVSNDDSVLEAYMKVISMGPLCNEPIMNVEFKITLKKPKKTMEIVDCLKEVFLQCKPKLLVAAWRCEVLCLVTALGAVHSVVSRRKGFVLKEDVLPDSQFFHLVFLVPAINTLNINNDLSATGKVFLRVISHESDFLEADEKHIHEIRRRKKLEFEKLDGEKQRTLKK